MQSRALLLLVGLQVSLAVSPWVFADVATPGPLGEIIPVGRGHSAWMVTDARGRVHVVYDGKYRLGTGLHELGPEEVVGPHVGDAFMNPKIDVDPAGSPHVVYQTGRTKDAASCHYTTRRNGVWIFPERFAERTEIGPATARTMLPDVAADESGRVLACVWASENDNALAKAVYRWRDEAGTWSEYRGGLSRYHAASPKVEEHGGRFYLHYARNDWDKILVGPVVFGETFPAEGVDFASRAIQRSFQNEGTNFSVTSSGRIVAAGNFRKTPAGGGVGIWVSDNERGAFEAAIVAEFDGAPPDGKQEGHQQPVTAIDEATGDVYVTYFCESDDKAYYQVRHAGRWSPRLRLVPEREGVQGYFRCGPSVADLPGPGVVVCITVGNEVLLRTLGATETR